MPIRNSTQVKSKIAPVPITDLPGAVGIVRLSRFRPDAVTRRSEPVKHRTVYIPGIAYEGMEDNDIRGYLDGGFSNGWNQPGQSHVRLGRSGGDPRPGRVVENPKYGEHELLRFLQRWSGLRLPPGARVLGSRLGLTVQRGPSASLRVFVYAVRKDWCPGDGGRLNDSSSPPKVGEVWWRGPAFELEEWGLPGAGFASDRLPGADTPATPLTWSVYDPSVGRLSFESTALTGYIAERCGSGKPLLFLFKLADHQEDIPGSLLDIYSANFGDSVSLDRRPSLEILWQSDREDWSDEREITLEYGRTLRLEPVESRAGDWFAVSFTSAAGFDPPLIEVREGEGTARSTWRPVAAPFRATGGPVEFRLTAARNVVPLGSVFTASIRETWTPANASAELPIAWHFISPAGEEHRVDAGPTQRHVWTVRFRPNEVGRWRYRWAYCFDANYPVSGSGVFDVVGRDVESIMQAVEALARKADAVRAGHAPDRSELLHRLRVCFSRLQRAALALETPETFRSAAGEERRRSLRLARQALWGKPLPEPFPMRPHPRDWPAASGPATQHRRRSKQRLLRRAVRRLRGRPAWNR